MYTPDPIGTWAPSEKGHRHVMRPISWTLDGPLRVLMGCAKCSKTEVVRPSTRICNIPEGFTPESWAKFLQRGAERDEQIRLAAREI